MKKKVHTSISTSHLCKQRSTKENKKELAVILVVEHVWCVKSR